MVPKRREESYSERQSLTDEEVATRTRDALRLALSTRYEAQRELVGKVGKSYYYDAPRGKKKSNS